MTVDSMISWLMVVAGGMFAGGIFFVAVERVNLWGRMPVDQYVVDFRRSLGRLDPLLPLSGIISALASIAHAVNSSGFSSAASWSAGGLIGAVIVTSVAIGEPINSKFRRLPEGRSPVAAEQLRITWGRFHMFRTYVALLAFMCIAVSVV